MLQHQETSQEETKTSAEQRITSEELTQALAAIEARKAEIVQDESGTLPLSKGLQEIGSEFSDEDVYAEILTLRAEASTEQAQAAETQKQRKRKLLWKRRAISGAVTCLLVSLSMAYRVHHLPPASSGLDSGRMSAPGDNGTNHLYPYDVDAISDIPNNQPFYGLTSEVEEIIQGTPLANIQVISNPVESHYAPWTLIKHAGAVYIRGWISGTVSDSTIAQSNVIVYNASDFDQSSGLTPITINTHQFHSLGFFSQVPRSGAITQSPVQVLSISHLHFDKYAQEKW